MLFPFSFMYHSRSKQTIGWGCIILMTDEDFDFLEKVYNKLRSARVTGSSVRLNSAEIKIILKNEEDLMAMMKDMFDDEFEKEVNCNED